MADDQRSQLDIDHLERMRERLELLKLENKLTGDAETLLQKNLDLATQKREVLREEVGALQKAAIQIAKLGENSAAAAQIRLDLGKKGLSLDEGVLQAKLEQLATSEADLLIQKQSNTAADKLLKSTLGISSAWKGSATGALATSIAMATSAGGAAKMWTSIKGVANAANMAMSSLQKIVEMSVVTAKAYDKTAASIRQVAGAESGLEQAAYDGYRANIKLGISLQEAGEATNSLYRNMASFSHASEENVNILRDQAAMLKEVGVGLEISGQMFNVLDKGLGMSAPEIKDYTAKLYDMSEQLKVPPDVIFKDWQASSKELMKYGDGMVDVLEGLEHQSKNTGLAVGDLLGIAKQFDQFDTAGEAVGRLNAILGGPYLNAIDMVYMTEDERIEALRETISLSGQVWKDMGRHEQQAIAAAAGISDMAQAAQLFGGTQTEFTDAAANQEALAERAKQAQSAMDNIARAMEGLAVAAGPLIDNVILPFSQGLADLAASPVGSTLMSLAAVIIFLGGVAMAYQKYQAASITASQIQALVATQVTAAEKAKAMATSEDTAATVANTIAQGANNTTEASAALFKAKSGLSTMGNAGSIVGETGAKGLNTTATHLNNEAEVAGQVVKKWSTVLNWRLAASWLAVGVAIMVGIGAFIAIDTMLSGLSPGLKGIIGLVLALAGAWALFYAISSMGAGLPALAVAAAGAGVLAAGFKGVVQGAQEYHDGGIVKGIRGENKQATLAAGETVLPTHKKSDDQAVADAESKGQLSLTKDKGFEEVTQAINNLVAKLNTMITQSEERAKGGGKEKAVEVTMELDRDKVGEATASWLEEKYGWTGA